jgi:hypothetical protein
MLAKWASSKVIWAAAALKYWGIILGKTLFWKYVKGLYVKIAMLKYGICNKSFRKDEPLTSWTYLSSLLDLIAIVFSNHAQKWGQILCKSVQLVRGSSFRNDSLQNPYFSNASTTFSYLANSPTTYFSGEVYPTNLEFLWTTLVINLPCIPKKFTSFKVWTPLIL